MANVSTPIVSVVMGSDSDYGVMEAAVDILKLFKIPYEAKIVSAHRTPELMFDYARDLRGRGVRVVIAGAGGAAHLPGMIASLSPLPVIGVPVAATALQGQDSLLSIVQMPRGIPVATVAIGNATNAALLAVQILACSQEDLMNKVVRYREKMAQKVKGKKLRSRKTPIKKG